MGFFKKKADKKPEKAKESKKDDRPRAEAKKPEAKKPEARKPAPRKIKEFKPIEAVEIDTPDAIEFEGKMIPGRYFIDCHPGLNGCRVYRVKPEHVAEVGRRKIIVEKS